MGTTDTISRFIIEAKWEALPSEVQRHAVLSFFNYLAVAIGGSRYDAVTSVLRAAKPFLGEASVPILGRPWRADALVAAVINGMTAHLDDYDDTHLETVIHPSAPVAPVLFSLLDRVTSGADCLVAFTVGCEVALRAGMAVYPEHYEAGWHITGTCGALGAAAAAGRIIGLDLHQMRVALGFAATQASGVREAFGSMTKPFHPGNSAASGLLAVWLAEAGATASTTVLDDARGFLPVFASHFNGSHLVEGLGERWEFLKNAFKPYPCGVVIHPAADAALALREQLCGNYRAIEEIVLEAHPLVLELTGKQSPTTGLEGKFSVYHCVAACIVDGALAVPQFEDSRVLDPEIVRVRQRVRVKVNPTIRKDEVKLHARLADGRTCEIHIPHARGSLHRPLTEDELLLKAEGLIDPVLGKGKAAEILRKVENLPRGDRHYLRQLVETCLPGEDD